MMSTKTVLRKTIKALLWVALIVVFIFLIVAALIRIPSIQTKIVQSATSFISNKTHTKVELNKVSISFPKSIVIEGLYLEDLQKDTLLFAGKAAVNIALLDLLSSKITINSFKLNNTILQLYNSPTDPLFNYNFLLTAFNDTTQKAEPDTLSVSKWTFNIDEIQLKNFRFLYHDAYAGMFVKVVLENSEISVNEINPQKSVYDFDKLFIEGLITNVLQTETTNIKTGGGSVMPKILANQLQLKSALVNYSDSVGSISVHTNIDELKLEDAIIDLEAELLTAGVINMAESDIQFHDFKPVVSADSLLLNPAAPSQNNWKVNVSLIDMEKSSFEYQVGNLPELKDEFNSDHLKFRQVFLKASDFHYSSDLTKVSVKEFSAVDQNNFVINHLETNFSMDEHSINATKLKLETPHSTIDADFQLQFTSLEEFTSTFEFTGLNLDMRNVTFKNPFVRYFSSSLNKISFFKNNTNVTTITGLVTGPMNKLTGKNLVLKTGTNTLLQTDFDITGLPDIQTAYFNFPNLEIHSGKQDLAMMAGSYIPENISVPENINIQLVFNGQMKSFETTAAIESSFGNANFMAEIDKAENFNGNLVLQRFNLGLLLNDTLFYGPVSLTAQADGQGLDLNTIKAKIKANVTQIYLNQYNYQHLTLDGKVAGKQFEGKINLNDENAAFDFDGMVNLNPGKEKYKFFLNMQGIDLKRLNFVKDDIRISFTANADMEGGSVNKMNGTAGINNIIVAQGDKKYFLDHLMTVAVNEPNKSELNINSALIQIKYSGTVSPDALPDVLNQFVNNYFPFSDSILESGKGVPSKFNFEIQLHNHPILSEVLFPDLNEFQPGLILGSFDSELKQLKLNATVKKLVYGTIEVADFAIDLNSDITAMNYKISSRNISNDQFSLASLLIDGKLADKKITTSISSIDEKKFKKLSISTQINKEATNYKLTLDPANFFLMNKQWNIAADNYIEFGKQGLLIHNLLMNNSESQIKIASVNDRVNDDLNIFISNFKLEDLSGIVEKDTALISGTTNGNVLLKRINDTYGFIADVSILNILFRNISIGNLKVNAENTSSDRFNVEVGLTGNDNDLTAKGYYIPNGGANAINITTDIRSLTMKTLEAFSMGQVTEAEGSLKGYFLISGSTASPDITGKMVFSKAFVKPTFLNNRIEMKNETIQLKTDGIYFDHFTITDTEQKTAILNGVVKMKQFSDFNFAFNVTTSDFMLFNTTVKDNQAFFGRMIIDSKIDVSGPMALPVVNARLKMKRGSNFTFVVPEDRLTTDKGEDVVVFNTGYNLHPILERNESNGTQKNMLTGFDVSSIIEIDKLATLRLLMDPASSDSLVVKGEAALSFTMDRSGKMSLTGAYHLSEGSYLVSLESIIKKRFDIEDGSTIIWNGDPLDADIVINAKYTVRTAPFDLVADQLSGITDSEKGEYKQRYPFLVLLKLRGKILQPVISFEIQLNPEDKGILGGAVNQKLSMLNEDPSALNKQVFALLVLGRFVQENPFQTESAGTLTLIRSTVSKFLSNQLNMLSSKVVPGVELNFDIQSYDDYQSGQAQGRTQVEIGVKKQLFDERLSIQLGGTIDVEGDKVKQNSASDITSDVTVEYKLNKDGSLRLKGFRHNQYEGAIEGQLVETGAGVVYVRDFNRWRRFFGKRPPKSPQGGLKE